MSAKTITLDAHVARYIAGAVLPAVSRDDVTPVLTGAHFTIEEGQLRVTSTDRYRAHTVMVRPNDRAPKELDVIVPRQALTWITKNAGMFSRSRSPYTPVVRMRFTEERVSISVLEHGESSGSGVDEVAYSTSVIKGKFPPVIRIIVGARDAETEPVEGNLRTDYLASVSAISDGVRAAHIKFTKGGKNGLPGPVYLRSGVAEAIIQPTGEQP